MILTIVLIVWGIICSFLIPILLAKIASNSGNLNYSLQRLIVDLKSSNITNDRYETQIQKMASEMTVLLSKNYDLEKEIERLKGKES